MEDFEAVQRDFGFKVGNMLWHYNRGINDRSSFRSEIICSCSSHMWSLENSSMRAAYPVGQRHKEEGPERSLENH